MPRPASVEAQNSAQDVFALLDHVLSSARIRLRKDGKPIVFEMLPEREPWVFDPKADGALFRRGDLPGVLRVRCRPELLARMVTDPAFALGNDDDASFEGDIEDLLLMVAAFESAGNALGIRATRKTK